MRSTAVLASIFTVLLAAQVVAEDKEPKHLVVAHEIVGHLDMESTSYKHGKPDVRFVTPYLSHADCSGFVDALLAHCYEYTADDFKQKFGRERPTADVYHDVIVKQEIFEQISDFRKVRAGDLLAVKYKFPKEKSTGHLMLVAATPSQAKAKEPVHPETSQWEVPIIDSARSGHGKLDTRHGQGEGGKDHDGLGQGTLRVYTDKDGKVTGYTWSVSGKTFLSQEENDMVMGRLKTATKK